MKRGATKATRHAIYENIAWRNHVICERQRRQPQSSMIGRSYK